MDAVSIWVGSSGYHLLVSVIASYTCNAGTARGYYHGDTFKVILGRMSTAVTDMNRYRLAA